MSNGTATLEQWQAVEAVWLSSAELAERWRVSPRTLANVRSYGGGVPYTKIGSRVLYALADIRAYEAAHRIEVPNGVAL